MTNFLNISVIFLTFSCVGIFGQGLLGLEFEARKIAELFVLKMFSEEPPLRGRYFMFHWDKETQIRAHKTILEEEPENFDEECNKLWFDFKAREHFDQVKSHKKFVIKVYQRFQNIFQNLTIEVVEKHDDSKLTFLEILGYTDRWIHKDVNSKIWALGECV